MQDYSNYYLELPKLTELRITNIKLKDFIIYNSILNQYKNFEWENINIECAKVIRKLF